MSGAHSAPFPNVVGPVASIVPCSELRGQEFSPPLYKCVPPYSWWAEPERKDDSQVVGRHHRMSAACSPAQGLRSSNVILRVTKSFHLVIGCLGNRRYLSRSASL